MLQVKGYEECRRAGHNLRKFYEERTAKRTEISRQEEQLRLLQGQLDEAENVLSRIEEAAAAAGNGAIALAFDLAARDGISGARDATELLARLTRLSANQAQRIRKIKDDIRIAEQDLDQLKSGLSVIERDIGQTLDRLRANDCPPPFE